MKLKYYIQTGVVALAAATVGVSCTDTWDDHYSVNGTVPGATLWENMQLDESIRPFVRVLDSCGYKDILNANQVFTVWAPEITDAEAQEWIDTYKREKSQGIIDDDNSTLNQFIKNHIAMYNQQVSSLTKDETVKMMNGKRLTLTGSMLNGEVNMVGNGVPSSNGMLYKVDGPATFFPNIWERLRMDLEGDNGLDSVANFFLSWNRIELDEEASVPGGIVDGETVYLASVMYNYNPIFNQLGRIDSEDSLYWFVAPTNKIWKENIDLYRSYFEYHQSLEKDGDSLQNLYSKFMFLYSSFFNVRSQELPFNEANPDSIVATTYTSFYPDCSNFEWPMQAGGLLYGLTPQECSNGRLYKATDWRIPPTKLIYMTPVQVEAEYANNYSTVTLSGDSTSIQVNAVEATNENFKVSAGGYLVVRDARSGRTNQPEITFKIPSTLSNCPYDIKVVFASPLAGDSLAKEDAQLKRQFTAKIRYYSSRTGDMIEGSNAVTLCTDVDVDATKMDTVTVATGFESPVCNYGEEDPRVLLTIQSIKGRTVPDGYSKDLAIDCVIFEPRPTSGSGSDEN